MKYLKTKYFVRWAKREGISDKTLATCITEFEQGLFEASLGHYLFKKRVPLLGRGKRGGARTVFFYQKNEKMIFCFGFAKNVKDNLGNEDKTVLHKLSESFLKLSLKEVNKLIKNRKFFEVEKEGV